MSDEVILALILLVPSAILPTIILYLNNRAARLSKESDAAIRKAEKAADYARADEIERRRKAEADEVARLLKNNTAAQVESAGELKGQIQQVHALVNSNLTVEMEQRLVVMRTGLASLMEITELRKALGHPENETTTAQIREMRERITELMNELETRKEVTNSASEEKRVTAMATKAAVNAITAAGPIPVTVKQEEGDPVPVKPVTEASGEAEKG